MATESLALFFLKMEGLPSPKPVPQEALADGSPVFTEFQVLCDCSLNGLPVNGSSLHPDKRSYDTACHAPPGGPLLPTSGARPGRDNRSGSGHASNF